MTKLPSEIVQELLDLGLSQVDISKRTGIPQPTVHRIYHQVVKRPRYDSVVVLIDLLAKVSRAQRKVSIKKSAEQA